MDGWRYEIDVATANIQDALRPEQARRALSAVLEHSPDLIGLQEWYPTRSRVLAQTGRIALVPHLTPCWSGVTERAAPAYLWNAPLIGGCVVGARADRFEPVQCSIRFLSCPGLGDRRWGRRSLEPGRAATVSVYRDLHLDRIVSLINYHLVSGVQSGDSYRPDRPVLVARHRHEVQVLHLLIREQLSLGHVVYATGDSNFDGLRLEGLTSAWVGRADAPGTLGPRRKVDDVHGPGPATTVTLIATGSDHQAILTRRQSGEA